jgi:hypothetical protein
MCHGYMMLAVSRQSSLTLWFDDTMPPINKQGTDTRQRAHILLHKAA